MKNFFKSLSYSLLFLFLFTISAMSCGILWRSPAYYKVKEEKTFLVPIMSMNAYDTLANHSIPYIYNLKNNLGSVYILGIRHTKDDRDPQLDTINKIWEKFKPDIVFVEGRMGFLFTWFQNPIKAYGESGEVVRLAKHEGVDFYTWEPEKKDEIKILLNYFSAKQLAFFYSLRPYLSNFRYGKPENPDNTMFDYINSRTDIDGLRNQIKSVAQIDSMWVMDYPNSKNWRDTSDEYGWPKGYLFDIAAMSNDLRDIHMCSVIIELVNQGKNVFVSMGASHAFRIEKTLRSELIN